MNLVNKYKKKFSQRVSEEMTIDEYIKRLKKDSSVAASPAERMLKAIGEPVLVDTSTEERLSRLFDNRVLRRYEAFEDFYGMEEVIEKIVSYFRHAAQGLEEAKQILYLLGPVGSAKSSLAERLKELMATQPIYFLKGSPIQESPLGLFDIEDAPELGIEERYLKFRSSGWALKRLEEYGGDLSKFTVVRAFPNEAYQFAISKTEPGDENNQDISALVGKVNIRQLEYFSQDDSDAYSYSGGLCRSNQGLLEFVEMFKAPIKMLHPLLTATQEGNYKGTESIPAIPFDGIILAHSNESEWSSFSANKNNEAFLDRICIVKVPYCTRRQEEVKIYQKLLKHSSLHAAACAPGTLEMLADFSIMSRLVVPDNSNIFTKLRVYNGENVKARDPKAKSLQEYKDNASGSKEAFEGVSTRDAFKVISQVFNYDTEEIAANPVHLIYVLTKRIEEDDDSDDDKLFQYALVQEILQPEYARLLRNDIQSAYLEDHEGFLQNLGDRYTTYADYWCQDQDYRDHDTGLMFDKDALNKELEKLEKPAGISNPKDYRHEVVNFCNRYRAKNGGNNPVWIKYNKMKEILQANLFKNTEEILPVISFSQKSDNELKLKHNGFLERMIKKGYTKRQVNLLVDWYVRYEQSKV